MTIEDEFVKVYSDISSLDGHAEYSRCLESAAQQVLADVKKRREKLKETCYRKIQALAEWRHILQLEPFDYFKEPYEPLLLHLDQELERFSAQLEQNSKTVEQLYEKSVYLTTILGEHAPPSPVTCGDPTISELNGLVRDLEHRVESLVQQFRTELQPILDIYEQLGESGVLHNFDFDQFSKQHFELLEPEATRLAAIKAERGPLISDLRSDIQVLAHKLGIEAQPVPLSASTSLTLETLEALKARKTVLETEFGEWLSKRYHSELAEYKEQCQYLGLEGGSFDIINELTCENLANENARLKALIAARKKLDLLCGELESLEVVEAELEAASHNSKRLTQRGYDLNDENKKRARVAIRKPRVVQMLAKLVKDWEDEHNERYVHNGRAISEVLAEVQQGRRRPPAPTTPAATARATSVPSRSSRLARPAPRQAAQVARAVSAAAPARKVLPAVRASSARSARAVQSAASSQPASQTSRLTLTRPISTPHGRLPTRLTNISELATPSKRCSSSQTSPRRSARLSPQKSKSPDRTPAVFDPNLSDITDRSTTYAEWRTNAIRSARAANGS